MFMIFLFVLTSKLYRYLWFWAIYYRREIRAADHFTNVLHINHTDFSLEFTLLPTRSVLNPDAKVTIYDHEKTEELNGFANDCILNGYSRTDSRSSAVISRCNGLVRRWLMLHHL